MRVKKPKKAKPIKLGIPTESEEQEMLARWLDAIGVLWCHVGNEGIFKPQYMAKRKRLGVKRGVPDVIVWTPCPKDNAPTVVELKRTKGGVLSIEQATWLESLRALGWHTSVCVGALDAIGFLRDLGYGTRSS